MTHGQPRSEPLPLARGTAGFGPTSAALLIYDRGRFKRTLLTRRADEPQHQALLDDMAHALVPEASDTAMQLYLEPTRLLRYHPFAKQLVLLELDPRA